MENDGLLSFDTIARIFSIISLYIDGSRSNKWTCGATVYSLLTCRPQLSRPVPPQGSRYQ